VLAGQSLVRPAFTAGANLPSQGPAAKIPHAKGLRLAATFGAAADEKLERTPAAPAISNRAVIL
jgi:hypothetical protein